MTESDLSEKRQQTRDRILDGALSEFVSRGYRGATLAGIAVAADVSTATLHKYFGTKREAFGGVISRFWDKDLDTGAVEDVPSDLVQGLTAIGLAYARLNLDPAMVPLVRVIIAESIEHPELGQELYERGKKPYLTRLEAFVRDHAAKGTLKVAKVDLAVRQFLGMINDVVFWPRMLIAGLDVTDDQAQEIVDEAVATFVARYGQT
jgi:TetR/AcrR family transcriptional regulator, regulator of autoinduction and epiphytic fitness